MKNNFYTLITAVIFFLANPAKAQNSYAFSYSSPGYTALANPIVVVTNSGFNSSVAGLPLGFTFYYWGMANTTFFFSTDAYCSFSGIYGFYPFYTQLKGLGNSQVGFEISGTPGNRIAKVEWKDVGFVADATNTDTVSVQVWLYETTNVVEIHFGSWTVQPSHFSAVFGSSMGTQVAFSNPAGNSFYNLQGNPAAPTAIYTPGVFIYLTGYPSLGTVYAFTPISQPLSAFSAPANGCTGAAITLTNNSTGAPVPTYTWSSNPATGVVFNPDNFAASPQVVFSGSGNYTITCMASNSAGNNSSSKTISVTACNVGVGLNEGNSQMDDLRIVPNPSEGQFALYLSPAHTGIYTMSVKNALGQLVAQQKYISTAAGPHTIDLCKENNGIYFITIDGDGLHVSKRVVLLK